MSQAGKHEGRVVIVTGGSAGIGRGAVEAFAEEGAAVVVHGYTEANVAEVVEASVADGKTVKVHRVTAAVDCGFAINPDQVVAQIQSAVIYGLSAALYGEITLEQGRIQQGNFDTYPVLRIEESPPIDVHIVENGGPLGGLGEPGLPPLAPALAGAIFAATGKRIRRLPLSVSLA